MCSFSPILQLHLSDRASAQRKILLANGTTEEKQQLNEVLSELYDPQQLGLPKNSVWVETQGNWKLFTVRNKLIDLVFIRQEDGPMRIMNQVEQIVSPAMKHIKLVHPEHLVVC
jgi:hypothetical protein